MDLSNHSSSNNSSNHSRRLSGDLLLQQQRPSHVRRQSSGAMRRKDPRQEKIVWASVSRNDVILAEAGEDPFGGAVSQAAHGILSKPFTPGWEFYTLKQQQQQASNKKGAAASQQQRIPKLKGIKFHVYEPRNADDEWGHADVDTEVDPIVWVFAAVYNPESVHFETSSEIVPTVKNFVQKLIGLTAIDRLEDLQWRSGETLACQETFAPTLLQRMQEVTYLGKLARVQQSLQDTTNLMQNNITAILDREERLTDMESRASHLNDMSMAFKKNTKAVRRRMLLQNAKYGAVLGGAITAVVAAIVIPPLVVAL